MRNIVLSNFESYRVDAVDNCDAYHSYPGYILLYNNGKVIKYKENARESYEICNLANSLFQANQENIPKALDIYYSYEKNSIFLFLCNGDIVSIEIKENNMCFADTVGSINGGLKACKWSPENELVALVTGNDTVIVMTNDLDPLSEVELHGGGFGEKQLTTVGWGKKETQFRGSEGKYKAQNNDDLEYKNEVIDHTVRISWRGDAELFAVSCINPETNQRYLRIFNKEGILQYTSETVIGLEHALDWKPSGNLIASTQRLPNKHVVCFFEKNGLKHGDFPLPFQPNEITVKELMWNEDSKLLAILIEKIGTTSNSVTGDSNILIYSVNNYYWYCKYSIPFLNHCKIAMKWDQKVNNLLHVIVKRDNHVVYNKYIWLWTVHKSMGSSTTDRTLVAVVDGSKLLITSFKCGILPPPMCTYTLETSSYVNQVGFAPRNDPYVSSNELFVHLSSGHINIYKLEYAAEKPNVIIYSLIGNIYCSNKFIYNIHWVSSKKFAFCEGSSDPVSIPSLSIIELDNFNMNASYREKKYPLKSSIAILKSISDSQILCHSNDGFTYLFNEDNEEYAEFCNQKRHLVEMEIFQKENSFIVFGLDKSNKFYINDQMLTNNITSFHIHQDFLLLTNLKHRLLCVPIQAEMGKFLSQTELNDVSSRRIERGSRIITSLSQDTKVVLQMPRGNLECIQPRALSFSIIGTLLDRLEYYNAFNIMRLQRINLNLLYDHNPVLFKENVHIFIEQIKDPAWISLFLSELVDEDVTKSMYSIIYKGRINEVDTMQNTKTLIVCELLENELGKVKNPGMYVLPVLTTYIKRGETQYLECALKKIKMLKEAENRGEKLPVTFDEAFRYMLYLTDVEDLYKVALGMYDFDLVLLVATKSQKDPKEYLPFLNNLKNLEINYQKFTVDKYLKRYEKALQHLLQCGGDDYFVECLTFIKTHKLYKLALKLVPQTTDRHKQICAKYADELLKSHLYEESGIMFSKAGSYGSAIAAFTKSGNWQEVISCSTKLKLTTQEINELYMNLAADLTEGKRFREASIIYMEYLKNIELAVIALTLGKVFSEAFRIVELHHRDDLLQIHIKPTILDNYKSTKTQLSSFAETYVSQRKRLRVVREMKLLQNKDFNEGCDMNSEHDSFSECSTFSHSYAGSRTTNRTFRSAKNKRKQERKLLSLKEGSPYEDLALIASLHNIATNSFGMTKEVRELNKALVKINEETLAEELQKNLETLLKEIMESKGEIWTPDLLSGRQTYGPEATSNSIAASFVQTESSAVMHLINPRLLIPPELQNNARWQLEILNLKISSSNH